MKVALAVSVLVLAGCSTLHEADPKTTSDTLQAIKDAKTLKDAAGQVDVLRDLYYAQVGEAKRDVLGTGDTTTTIGIGAGIAGASTGVPIDVFKGFGILAGSIGIWDLRYKPAQQRQYYLDAAQALGCVSKRARQLGTELTTLERLAPGKAMTSTNAAQLLAATDIAEAVEATHAQVVAIHRRLDDKLFSAVTSQSVATIRDSLIKDAVDAQKRADEIKSEPSPNEVVAELAATGKVQYNFTLPPENQSAATKQLLSLDKQWRRLLADGATYKTDIAACAADFLK